MYRTKKTNPLLTRGVFQFHLTTLRQNSISRRSIDAVREILASAVDLNPDIFPFLVVQSSEYLWYDALDSIMSAIR